MMNRRVAAILACGALLLAAGCADKVSSREDVVKKFTDAGLEQALAECVADGAIDEFGMDTLNENRDLTAEEQAVVEEIMTGCMLSGVGADDEPADVDAIDCSAIPDEASRADCEEAKDVAEDMEDEFEDMEDELEDMDAEG